MRMRVARMWNMVVGLAALTFLTVGFGTLHAQPALPIPEPGMDESVTPAPTPLFQPFQPGRVAYPTPMPAPFAPQYSSGPLAQPAVTPAPVIPSPHSALSVPSDYPRQAPRPTPTLQAAPATYEDAIPTEPGLDLSDQPSLLEPTPLPLPAATPQAGQRASAKPQQPPAAPAARRVTHQPQPAREVAPSPDQINHWVAQANKTQDAALATRIGWALYNRDEIGSAGLWFSQALNWDSQLGEAAYGLALTKYREGDLSSSEAIVNFRGNSYPKMKTLEGDIYSRRAMDYYSLKRYGQSVENMNRAAACRSLTNDEQIVLGWSYYYTKNYKASSKVFQRLYDQNRDPQSAQGLHASLDKLGEYDRLDRMAARGGPIKKVYVGYAARRYYEASLYRASYAVGGGKIYPELVNMDSPSVAFGIGYRSKSGTEGQGQLNMSVLPIIQGQFSPAEKTVLSAWIKRITLDAGNPGNGAWIGSLPRSYQPYVVKPQTEFNNLWEFGVGFSYVDWVSYYLQIGTTPQNGPLSARPTGTGGIIYRDLHGYYQGEIYSKSIDQSVLSYVGMQDPYTGMYWGRVQETGGSVSIFRSIGKKNTIFAKASYGWIDGTNVEDNTHFGAVVALSHEFNPKGFEYVTVGPAVSYEAYGNNQNHFTYGHGGYFSPSSLLQGIIQVQFLTKEGRRWLAAGSAGAGLQTNEQASAPYFPLKPDGRNYSSTSSTTGVGMINVTAGYLINRNWMLGGSTGFNVTADYNEGFINIWVRYFFEPRNGLIRDDLGLQGLTPVY